MNKIQTFKQWSSIFKTHKWSFLSSLERGSLGRSQFEMDAFEWPALLSFLKKCESFLWSEKEKEFIPRGHLSFNLTGHETLVEIWQILFFPASYGNTVKIYYNPSLTYFIETFKREFKDDFLVRKIEFIQKDLSMNSQELIKNQTFISASVLHEREVSEKELDHLMWSAFYGYGMLNGSLKIIFVPEEKFNIYFDRLTSALDRVRAPFVDKNLYTGALGVDEYKKTQFMWESDPALLKFQSVFHKDYKIYAHLKLNDFKNWKMFVPGPYVFMVGYKYLKTLIEKLNRESLPWTSVSFFGAWDEFDKKECEHLLSKNISFHSHLLLDGLFSEFSLEEWRASLAIHKQVHSLFRLKKPYESDFFYSWKNTKMTEDLSRFKKALPEVSKRLLEKMNQSLKLISIKK